MKSIKLLLIEDNEEDTFYLKELLSSSEISFEIDWKDSLDSGIKAIKENSYDVIITDLTLQKTKGLETFEKIVEISPLETPILILTGLNDKELGLKAVAMGAQDYIVKDNLNVDLFTKSINYAIERKILENKLRELSNQDDVTDLLNRRGFEFLATQHFKLAKRSKKSFTIVFFDLDGLKKINDTHGHLAGSKTIVETSRILTKIFRSCDLIARWGGDEFIVLAAETSKNSENVILEKLENSINEFNQSSKLPYDIQLSIGLSFYDPLNPKTLEEMVSEADKNMYEHKNFKKKQNENRQKEL